MSVTKVGTLRRKFSSSRCVLVTALEEESDHFTWNTAKDILFHYINYGEVSHQLQCDWNVTVNSKHTSKETRLQYFEGQTVKLLFSTNSYSTDLFCQLVSCQTVQKVYKSEPLVYAFYRKCAILWHVSLCGYEIAKIGTLGSGQICTAGTATTSFQADTITGTMEDSEGSCSEQGYKFYWRKGFRQQDKWMVKQDQVKTQYMTGAKCIKW